jgi:acetylglutamate kinase
MNDILVAKIGGSTLGSHDTTLQDIVELQRNGVRPVVVHGGGALINEWLTRHGLRSRFERGLRVTDEATLKVVVAVLAGLVNKEIVASLGALGARALGLSGADSGLLRAKLLDEKLGFVGEITSVDTTGLMPLLQTGVIPVIAPVAVKFEGKEQTAQLLNINADTAAGAIAAALKAHWLVFLTDVPGVRTGGGKVLSRLSVAAAGRLMQSGAIEGGMIPKVEACLAASAAGCHSVIADGRAEHALLAVAEGRAAGTIVA